MAERKKVLWLVSWYPNKYDHFDGDFIQRQARAAALYDRVHILFIKQHEQQKEIERYWSNDAPPNLSEQIIYIPKHPGLFGKWKNHRNWMEIYKAQVGLIIQRHKPDLIHVHIPWKVGLVALWIKKKYGIPFIVTEHWGIYNRIVDDNIHTKSFPVRHLLRRIYKEATAFISVSKYLGEGVNKTLTKKEYSVIPNVVDTSLFHPGNEKHHRFTFLHVSNMVPLKNVEGILRAFHQFLQTGIDAQLILIGNKDNHHEKLAKELELLDTSVFFRGEIPYADVAKEMQRSHVFVFNSNIENSPCVIGEALCCGLPVITTNVGGIPELISQQNGTLIPPASDNDLSKAMTELYSSYVYHNSKQIAEQAKDKFSYATIAKQIHTAYNTIV